MEERLLFLLTQISSKTSEIALFQELDELTKNPEIINHLLNFITSQSLDHNIRFLSLIILNNSISQCFNTISQDNYIQLKQISEILKEKALFIFYSQRPNSDLIPQLIFLFTSIYHRLDFFYSKLFETIPDLPSPQIFEDITPILVEIIQNEPIRRNAFTIAIEFISDSYQHDQKIPISPEFCKFIYPCLNIPDLLRDSITILTHMKDFSIIPILLENIEKFQNSDDIVQLICLIQTFSNSLFDDSIEGSMKSSLIELFLSLMSNISVQMIRLIQMDIEHEMIILEAIQFYSGLFGNILKYMDITPESNELCSTILQQFIYPILPVLISSLFEKVGADESLQFFGVSLKSIYTLKLISNLYPKELFSILFEQINSILSSFPDQSTSPVLIFSSLRTYSHILFVICKNSDASDQSTYLQFAFENSMKLIQTPEYCVDSAILFKKSLKTLSYLQSESEDLKETFDLDTLGNQTFFIILQAYSAYDYEVQKQLLPILSSILDYCDIPTEPYLEAIIQFVYQSESINDLFLSSQLLIHFIVKSELIDPINEQLIADLIQFVLKGNPTESLFFSISIGILDAIAQKFSQFTPLILSAVWPKLNELLDYFVQDEDSFSSFNIPNNENIALYPLIIHFLNMISKSSIEIDLDINEIVSSLIEKIPHFLNAELPLAIRLASWKLLNNLISIAFIQIPETISENQLIEYFASKIEYLIILSKIVKFGLSQEFSLSGNYEIDENDRFEIEQFLNIIALSVFTLDQTSKKYIEMVQNPLFIEKLANQIDPAEFFLFSPDEEAPVAVQVLSNLYNAINSITNYDLTEIVACSICSLCLIPNAAKVIKPIIDSTLMQQIMNRFGMMNDEAKKQIVALGSKLLFTA